MKNKLLYALIGVLVLFSLFNTASNIQSSNSLSTIRSTVESIPKEPVVYVGKDGKTPQLGIDYFIPKNGKDGVNSISFSTTHTIIKEVPLAGEPGKDGRDGQNAPTQMIQVNKDTLDIETKLSNLRGWNVLVSCADYRKECPNVN